MKILAVGFEVSKHDLERLHSLLHVTRLDTWPIETTDLQSEPLNLEGIDLVLLFGSKVQTLAQEACTEQRILSISLPPIKLLHPPEEGGNAEARSTAYTQLVQLREDIQSGHVSLAEDRKILSELSSEDVPPLSLEKILSLEQLLQKGGRTGWRYRTSNGRTILVYLGEKPTIDKTIDATLSIAEVLALRLAADTFQWKSVEFLGKPTSENEK